MQIQKFNFHRGTLPLLVSMPHTGEHIPDDIKANMTPSALQIADTDWHMPLLYDFLKGLGVSVLEATHSRYVIDLNRPQDNVNLYPGQDTTGLCPVDTFHKEALYQPGKTPDEAEITRRVQTYWQPYHAQLDDELRRMRAEHGIAMLWDAHSIASVVPRFFEGQLPDLNLGTASGASCAPELAEQLRQVAADAAKEGYSHALNGRFKGGHITRHYGQPQNNIHAVQLELTQCTYMEEQLPFAFKTERAEKVRPTLQRFIEVMLTWADKAQRTTM
ncbi:N-formylglutamate deformylase [Glaciimonas soli]|uniref:N-formylglutamate deformylase n=1 Tax=Glaciimonas soli TaxID=2590999 RepID=A0A843YLV0_9BURK|nr:N-formylglutamate deformylase [Glaciimonas soli]MQQ99889.1 N-formylglutamate deformylase [Glaciimonas soli]